MAEEMMAAGGSDDIASGSSSSSSFGELDQTRFTVYGKGDIKFRNIEIDSYSGDSFTIDFGDGTLSTFTENIDDSTIVHTYEAEGFYEIKITNTIRSLVTLYEDPGTTGIGLVQLFNIANRCFDIGGFAYSAFTCNRPYYKRNDYANDYISSMVENKRSLNIKLGDSQDPSTLYNSIYWKNNVPAVNSMLS